MATPRGGYVYDFVNNPHDRYVCKICIHPCRDPYLSLCCGHNFCKWCVDNFKNTVMTCPVCRTEDYVTVPNKQADREIRNFHVFCTNKERGCEWKGELNDINNHLVNSDGCQFEDVKCSNGCGKLLQRWHLTGHVGTECPCRMVGCHHCYIIAEHQFIEGEHKEQCPKFPLPCPNKCKVGNVPREDMEAHRKECPLELVLCSNSCLRMFQRQHMPTHIDNECPNRQVDCQYCHITGKHRFIESGLHKIVCCKFPIPCPNQCEVGSVPREDMEVHRKECPLEMVQCEYHNVGCEERMRRKHLANHSKEKMEEHLSFTKSELSYTKSQLATALHQISKMMIVLHQTVASNTHEHVNLEKCESSIISAANWTVMLTAKAAMFKSGDQVCPVIMSITEFNKTKVGKDEWYSDSFFSHDKGFKMTLNVCLNGDGKGRDTHLSLYLCLMKGPHDDELAWPLTGKFEVTLLNQISDCKHRSMTITYGAHTSTETANRVTAVNVRSNGWGRAKYISNVNLYQVTPTYQYLKDDCIFLQVIKL